MFNFIRSLLVINKSRKLSNGIKYNSYAIPTTLVNGASVTTPDGFAVKQRIARLKRELKINSTNQVKAV